MSFSHPKYAHKMKALATDPAAQVIRGTTIEIRGYPHLNICKIPELRPPYYYDKTLKAGK